MTYTPTGNTSKALEILRDTVAGSATFRALTGTSTNAEAVKRVIFPTQAYDEIEHDDQPERRLVVPRPRMIVNLGDGWLVRALGPASSGFSWPLYMAFEAVPPAESGGTRIAGDRTLEMLWFCDQWEAILREMRTLMAAGVDGDANVMLARDANLAMVQKPDVMQARDTVGEQTFYAVAFQWTIDAPFG